MPTNNIFEAILGTKSVKWDAFWHLFEWLLNESEGHALGDSVRRQLMICAFGTEGAECTIKREYPVSGQTDGKGKWADLALGIPNLSNPKYLLVMDDIGVAGAGGMRKLNNLNIYIEYCLELRSDAIVRCLAVTDAPVGVKLKAAVYETLGPEAGDFSSRKGWKLLSLQTIATWVQSAMDSQGRNPEAKMEMILGDFVSWCAGADAKY